MKSAVVNVIGKVAPYLLPVPKGGPEAGDRAPLFSLKRLDGKTVSLAEHLGKRPIVLEFGSYTCPVFRYTHPAMERLSRRYGDKAAFLTVYTLEAHPQTDPCPYTGKEWVTYPNEVGGILYRQPVLEEQRGAVARDAYKALRIRTPLLLDDMDNSIWKAYGKAVNPAFLIGKDGTIKLKQGWFKPYELEKALLEELGGRPRKPIFKGRPTALYVLMAGAMAAVVGVLRLGLWGAKQLGGQPDPDSKD